MKLSKQLAIFIASLCIFSMAYARTQAEVIKDLNKATDIAVATYKKQGMAGLIGKTQDCYEKVKNSPYCVYFDVASRCIDQIMVEAMHFPPNEFFVDEPFLSRVGPVLIAANMDMNVANEYLSTITPVINNLVEKKIFRK